MLQFEKYHGTGNDFIIFDFRTSPIADASSLAMQVCQRHMGIGADGMMLVRSSDIADVKMDFYNADGSRAPMCGNGIRCFSKYVYDHGIVEGQRFSIETLAGTMHVELHEDEAHTTQVTVNMGLPKRDQDLKINIERKIFDLNTLVMGTDHCVIFTEAMSIEDIEKYGKSIESHAHFPEKINVNFVEVIDDQHITVNTFERGVGRTLSCGTGSAASAVLSHFKGYTQSQVHVQVPGGNLFIHIREDGVHMTGPAALICKGDYHNE